MGSVDTPAPGGGPAPPARDAAHEPSSARGSARTRTDRKAETQARIVEAATQLFVARGYAQTSVASVAARARVSRATVFWHFGDKETLFRETLRRMLTPFVEELRASLEGDDPARRLLDLFDVYERFVEAQSDAIRSLVRWVLESTELRDALTKPLFVLHDQFLGDLEEALVELLEEPAEAHALAAGLASALHGNLLLSLLEPDAARQKLRGAGVRRLVERALQGRRA
jgi:AcrR family transcriptional regulator